jgi:hypothetical protein
LSRGPTAENGGFEWFQGAAEQTEKAVIYRDGEMLTREFQKKDSRKIPASVRG